MNKETIVKIKGEKVHAILNATDLHIHLSHLILQWNQNVKTSNNSIKKKKRTLLLILKYFLYYEGLHFIFFFPHASTLLRLEI